MSNRCTIRSQLVAKQDGFYTQYIFKNLETEDNTLERYLMVTKCPNWQMPKDLAFGKIGYLTFEPAQAGETYYRLSDGEQDTYKYTGYYFISFVEEQQTEDDNIKEFKF